MHDPLTVAFEIRRPWPRRDTFRTEQAARTEERWKVGGAFWVLAGRALYWPCMITIWHRDPSAYDDTTCRSQRWRWHVHHWRIQVVPLQSLRRRLLTRCAWCKGRHTKSDPVNLSHQWESAQKHWWKGEDGLYHRDCSLIWSAHRTCLCADPWLTDPAYRGCIRCGKPRAFGMTEERLVQQRHRVRIPRGQRSLPPTTVDCEEL